MIVEREDPAFETECASFFLEIQGSLFLTSSYDSVILYHPVPFGVARGVEPIAAVHQRAKHRDK